MSYSPFPEWEFEESHLLTWVPWKRIGMAFKGTTCVLSEKTGDAHFFWVAGRVVEI